MNTQQFEPIENLSLQKSNSLVSAKYKSSLIENQIMAIALTRIEVNGSESASKIQARLWPGELKKLIGDPTNIYKTLKRVSQTMNGHTMFIEDGKGNFHSFAVVTDAIYEDGVFTVIFNDILKQHVLGLEKNYTSFELAILTRFKKNSSFRLYELLKSVIYKSKSDINDGRVDVEYNISELRFMIGLANGDDPGVKNAMAYMTTHVDWDKLYSKLDKKDRKYETWYDFQRYVIKPAQEELEEKSNVRFEYEGIRDGKKMSRILFHVFPNEPSNADVIDERKDFIEENAKIGRQFMLPRDLPQFESFYKHFVGHNDLTAEDIDILLKLADYDAELVEQAITQADEQDQIENYMGWLVACVKSGGYQKTEVMSGSREAAAVIREISEKAHSPAVKQKVWDQTKLKADFQKFLAYMEAVKDITLEELDVCYDPGEAAREYIDWKKNIN